MDQDSGTWPLITRYSERHFACVTIDVLRLRGTPSIWCTECSKRNAVNGTLVNMSRTIDHHTKVQSDMTDERNSQTVDFVSIRII